MYVFDVGREHTLHDAGKFTLKKRFYDVACTRRGDDTLVAFANSHRSRVALKRLVSQQRLRLKRLAKVDITEPLWLLFRGDLLLVADWNSTTKTHTIVSFRASGNALTERRVLLEDRFHEFRWALAGERHVIASLNELLVYEFS